jgi:uncharacterized protein YndB with AHSA1/START domain
MAEATPVASAEQQIVITRHFDAPREQVFMAWTDPDGVAAWYGPEHVDIPRDKIHIDARVGGRWEVTMVQRGGGRAMALGYEILELVEHELIVMRSDPMPEAGMHDGTTLRVEFADDDAGTRMTLIDGPYPPDGRGHAERGWNAAFDKLGTLLTR